MSTSASSPVAFWRWIEVPHIGLAFAAVACFALVPWLATRPERADRPQRGLQTARYAFAIGAGCMILAIAWFVGRDLISNHG